MKRLGLHLFAATALLLKRSEREAVLGDLEEAGEGGWRGFWDILGLVVRRQLALWLDWRPWLAAFGLALPGSLFLMGVSVSLSLGAVQLADPRAVADAGGEAIPRLAFFVGQLLLLIGWSWSGGLVLGSLSRPTLWASAVACCVPCLFCLSRFGIESLPRICLLLFLFPAMAGVRRGIRGSRLRPGRAVELALGISILMLPSWRAGLQAADVRIWIYNAAMCWPAWYLAAAARTSRNLEKLAL